MEFHEPLPPEKPWLHAFRIGYFRCLKIVLPILGLSTFIAGLLAHIGVMWAINTPGYVDPWINRTYVRHLALWMLGLLFVFLIFGLVLQNADPDPD